MRYIKIKNRTQFSSSPVQEGHALLFLESDSGDSYSLVAKLADNKFIALTDDSYAQDKKIKDTALIYALVFG